MKYSIVVPVYNRPEMTSELLESLCTQTDKDFEVIIVEDGSSVPSIEAVDKFRDRLDITYFVKDNGGPGPARNFGVEHAKGEYVLILDSDVILPDNYINEIEKELTAKPCDAFGGPDAANDSFTPIQKAISYSMTSFFTTGGIRGGGKKKSLDKFYPRSFNLGTRKSVYDQLGGFSDMRFGEDIDFSYRIVEGGYSCRLFPNAWVWHKRRTDLKKFFRQVFNSGMARINLEKRHPGTMKLVHLLPMCFTLGVVFLLLLALALLSFWPLMPLVLYALLILADSTVKNRSLAVGLRSVPAAYIQLTGYGLGFLKAWWNRCVLGRDESFAFSKNFYK